MLCLSASTFLVPSVCSLKMDHANLLTWGLALGYGTRCKGSISGDSEMHRLQPALA